MEIDIKEDFEYKNDPDFTRYTQKSFIATTIVSLIICPGLIYIGLTFGEDIDAFLKTKTGFWTLVGVVTIPGITWAILKVRAMIQEK